MTHPHSFLPLNDYTDPLLARLDEAQFTIPISASSDSHNFTSHLSSRLDAYATYIHDALGPQLESRTILIDGIPKPFLEGVNTLILGIKNAVASYYRGHVLTATQQFNEALKLLNVSNLLPIAIIPTKTNFYRTRLSSDHPFSREELFHNPFELRHFVNTNRYSIPGLPALYLGDSVYVCWEEYERPPIRNLYFSRFQNTTDLKVVKLQRLADFNQELQRHGNRGVDQLTDVERFLALFPLSLACTFRTRNSRAPFKPEYIVPQLLLQYITLFKEAKGIMFPSTKVDYARIKDVPAYNYVFPVQSHGHTGFCPELAEMFHLTQPTSLEQEELLRRNQVVDTLVPTGHFEYFQGDPSPYAGTAMGYLESILLSKKVDRIP